MREPISETVFQFTVMHPANMMIANLADALAEADTGNAVGDERVISTRVVPDRSVPSRLKKLGNDGTFFDDDGEYWADDEDEEPECTCGANEVSSVAQHLKPCPLADA